jgi:hypothetical protein
VKEYTLEVSAPFTVERLGNAGIKVLVVTCSLNIVLFWLFSTWQQDFALLL